MLNPDFHDILREFNAAEVEFLLVGAYALAVHGLPRATGDIDLWVACSPVNASRIMTALTRFGAPFLDIGLDDFTTPDIVYQIGISPRRIDILTSIDGLSFDEAWPERLEVPIEGLTVPVLSRRHLLVNKRAAGRPKDRADADWLEQTEPGS